MTYVIVLAVLFAMIFVVSAPLRRPPAPVHGPDDPSGEERDGLDLIEGDDDVPQEVLDLEAERDAKYREIRDAELDHMTGKLSDADYDAIDSMLRAEAVEILRRLDDVTEPDE
jgi:hypothetical protein